MKYALLLIATACVAIAIFVTGFSAGAARVAVQPAPHLAVPSPAVLSSAAPAPTRPLRLGVIGDSLTLPGPGAWADSWLRVLIDSQRVSCGDERPDPATCAGRSWRYAWAASGATTTTALERGWVAQAAQALRSGELDAVVVMIGIDDLALFQDQSLAGRDITDMQWDAACTRIETNWLRMAHDLRVGKGLVLFSELPDPTGIPLIRDLLRQHDAEKKRLQTAIQRLNDYLGDLSASQDFPLFDFIRRQRELAMDPAAQRLPGLTLLPLAWGLGADRGFAPDGIHLGPVPTGVLAAGIVETLNGFQANIRPLHAAELTDIAQSFVAAANRRFSSK